MTDAPKVTYRHRNTKKHTAARHLIHTFWVGQRVIRSYERAAYIDKIEDEAIVTALPEPGDEREALTVQRADGTTHRWSPTEATPYRVWAETNAKRLRSVAKIYTRHLQLLDENGNPIPAD